MRLRKVIFVIVAACLAYLILFGDLFTIFKQSYNGLSHRQPSHPAPADSKVNEELKTKYNGDKFRIIWEGLSQDCKPAFVKKYIEKGYDVNHKGRGGMTLLMFAAGKSYESAKLLIDNGANVNASDSSGDTPLMEAVQNGTIETARLLLQKGARIDAKRTDGETVMFNALRRHNISETIPILDLLLKNGADIEARGYRGITPLMRAVSDGNIATAEYLIKKGARIDAQDDNGDTTLNYALPYAASVKLLIRHGADVNARDKIGRSVLMAATLSGNIEVVKVLLENGADVTIADRNGDTALEGHYYVVFPEIQKLLLDKGASYAKKFEGIDIIEPVEGQRYKMGDKGWLVVKAKSGVELSGVLLGFEALSYHFWSKTYVGHFQVPKNIQPGKLEMRVIAVTKDGKETEATRNIVAEFPPGVVLTGIELGDDGLHSVYLKKLPPGSALARSEAYEAEKLHLYGLYSDGIQRDEMTSPIYGSTYSTSNAQVAIVSPDGMVKAIGVGKAVITARNGKFTTQKEVIVKPYK